jgi:hypothetical protein
MVELGRILKRDISVLPRLANISETREGAEALQKVRMRLTLLSVLFISTVIPTIHMCSGSVLAVLPLIADHAMPLSDAGILSLS